MSGNVGLADLRDVSNVRRNIYGAQRIIVVYSFRGSVLNEYIFIYDQKQEVLG